MAVQGYVDQMEGAYVTGWAIAVPDSGNCAIVVMDSAGQVVGKGRASRHREDLATLGFGRSTLAYRIGVPHPPGQVAVPRELHIMANGQELRGSPIFTGPGLFDGLVAVEQDRVTGWVAERLAGFAAPFITIVNHLGIEVARGQSAFSSEDSDPLFSPARFELVLDDQCFAAGEMLLTVRANGVAFGGTSCNLSLIGNLDVISAKRCAGWLLSPAAPARVFGIEIYRDGRLAGDARNSEPREDVRSVHVDAATPGFDAKLDEVEFSATVPVTVSLRFAGCARDLFDGPYLIASRPAVVTAALRAAQVANSGLPGIGPGERAILAQAMTEYLARARSEEDGAVFARQAPPSVSNRLSIIIPIYRGVEITHACIASVLAHRNEATDQLVLINDCSPEPAMAIMLLSCMQLPNTVVLTNNDNLGFVRTVNRGLAVADGADVLLLNSDTVLHAGGLEELKRVAAANPEIGTVTAMSNNATIFSYPDISLRHEALDDISWPELAALALEHNAGLIADVPTGHGFCMLIKSEVLHRAGKLDEAFGRGYGEENDFCARAAALGYRNVAAGGVIVEHKESISFVNERASLLAKNLPRLNAMYPEYVPVIMQFEREDGMRELRWRLDAARLRRARAAGGKFVLVVSNALEGGTARAVQDIETHAGYGDADVLTLRVSENGLLELSAETPLLLANFSQNESAALLALLDAAGPEKVMVHQMLGFPAAFIAAFGPWLRGRLSVFWAHDFYAFCPRVTMIDAIGRFCGGPDAETCARCVEMEGAHEASQLTELSPAEHRHLFAGLLGQFSHVVTPSKNAAGYLSRIFPQSYWEVLPHPEPDQAVAPGARAGSDDEIVMLGAIGPHKGSHTLLEIARLARLTHPHLHFRVIGYTNIDKALKKIGNVTVTGKYKAEELPELLAEAKGRLGLFLPGWPETYSYTLSELVKHGFIPLVPDIGAPADRVRAAGFGVVMPFPATPELVLQTIDDIAAKRIKPVAKGASPSRFFSSPEVLSRLREITGHAPDKPGLVSMHTDAG